MSDSIKPSPEEVAEYEQKVFAFIDEQTPKLEKQVVFEELKARLEKARYEQVAYRVQTSEIVAAMKEAPTSKSESKDQSEKRTLKTD